MKIALFHADAGYGHKKVAMVTEQALLRQNVSGLTVVQHDILEKTSIFTRKLYPAAYFFAVKHFPKAWGWVYERLDSPKLYAFVRPFRSFFNRLEGFRWLAWAEQEKPDVIICTHFYSAELFSRAKREGQLKARLVVVITDFKPHTFWVNTGTDVYWVMNEEAKEDLLRRGVAADQIEAGGIPVDPVFKPQGKQQDVRHAHNLYPHRFTLLLTSGSFGLGSQTEILRAMQPFKDRVQAIVVCGQNEKLKRELEGTPFLFPVKIFGFVNFMPDLMEASDLLVAKAGGSTTVESLAKGVPLILFGSIPGQETRNADYLLARYAAFSMQEPSQIELILKNVLDTPGLLEQKKKTIQAIAKPDSADDLAKFVLGSANR
ncbi:MAG: hypothetical protein KBC91_02130 [Candidatus Omnitrophica bacterium]|nr:hypothetical protein [Candidatus Omnitrophota bacterium]